MPWEPARPADHLDKGAWWQVFNDAQLDRLMEQAQRDNPTLTIVAARWHQAQAASRLARSSGLPRVDALLRDSRQRTSANRPAATYGAQAVSTVQNDAVLTASVSYELDLFDRIGREADAATESERQARADLANARMVVAADLAASYFALRQVDAEIAVLQESVRLQRRAIDFMHARRDGGAASGADVAVQQAQIDSTDTQLELLKRQRPLLEHAVATLSGQPATGFTLPAEAAWRLTPPAVPAALPSEVLQRRPDVAAAQHAVAAANAQIGATRAAFYPSIVLGAGAGFESRSLHALLDGPSLVWSLGASVAQSIFDGGRNQARVALAQAAHEGVSAGYRRTVLQALQEVEDGLSTLHALNNASRSAQAAMASASKALDIAEARYQGGLSTVLDVVTAQQGVLNARRQATQINGLQLGASVYLIKALGGGWRNDEVAGL